MISSNLATSRQCCDSDTNFTFANGQCHLLQSISFPTFLFVFIFFKTVFNSFFLLDRRGAYTIVRRDGGTNLGQRYGLSPKDVQQANLFYCGSAPRPTQRPRPTQPPRPTRSPTGKVDLFCTVFAPCLMETYVL